MKMLPSLFLLVLVSCAPKKTVKIIENPFDNSPNDVRLTELENKVAAIELDITSNISAMGNLTNSLQTVEQTIEQLNEELEQSNTEKALELQNLIDSNNVTFNNLLALIDALQDQTNNNVSQLVELQSQNSVVEYLDPCGDSVGYDEIILKTSQGEFIAYFEQGNQRFLSKLDKNTSYQTTDSQACLFSIDNDGNLI